MTTTLFDDDDMDHRPDPAARRAVRRWVLAGVLQALRARNGWSVNDAASQASIAPMTWRRMEEGLDVRRRSLTALDKVLDLAFGTVTRALDNDAVMLDLAVTTDGGVIDATGAHTPAEMLDVLAERARSGTAGPRVASGHGTAAVTLAGRGRLGGPPSDPWAAAAAAAAAQAMRPAVSDLTRAAELAVQITRREMTPALENVVAAILAAMPDLITSNIHDATPAVDALACSANRTLKQAASEIARQATDAAIAAHRVAVRDAEEAEA